MDGTVCERYLNFARCVGYGGMWIVSIRAVVTALLCVCDPSFTLTFGSRYRVGFSADNSNCGVGNKRLD